MRNSRTSGAGGDLRGELVHLWGVELFCDILAVEQDPLVGSNLDGDLGEVQSLGESQGDGAVHRASVDEKASKAFCQGAGDARLAGASRAINGDLHKSTCLLNLFLLLTAQVSF
jgi:hypothetical protein